jgi:phosphatidylglycerophosphate synthase
MIDTKTPLTRINTANKITLFRITMVPVLLFLILGSSRYPVLPALFPLLGLTFLSDMADGIIARKNHERTFIGQILDSSSDYLLVGLAAIFYYVRRLLPMWLFVFILGRLIFTPLCVWILFRVFKKLEPATTTWGKITIASLMILLVFELLRLVSPWGGLFYVEIAAAGVLGISMVDKGVYLVKNLRRKGPGGEDEPGDSAGGQEAQVQGGGKAPEEAGGGGEPGVIGPQQGGFSQGAGKE